MTDSDITRLIERAAELERTVQALQRVSSREGRGGSFIGQVINGGSIPTSVPRYFLVNPVRITATEAEGAPISRTVDTSVTIPVEVLGPSVPIAGSELDCFWVGSRAVARFKTPSGSAGGGFIGCLCSGAPATLTMTVSPSGCGDGLLHPCTLAYGPTPPELGPLNIGSYSYLSTSSFTDPQTNDVFYYYLSCFSSIFRISRVFPSSIYGSPFLDAVVYYWTIGLPGNSCSPFLLSNGQIFFGGDPSCEVIIEE